MRSYSVAAVLVCCIAALAACSPDGPAPSSGGEGTAEGGDGAERVILERLTTRIATHPDDAAAYAQRGEVYYRNGVYDRAVEDLSAAVTRDSTQPEVWHLLADAQMDNLRSREALNTMIYAGSRFPERMQTLLKLAEFQYILTQHEDALATLDRAARLDPGEGEVFFMIGEVLREVGETDRAISAYVRATELKPDILDAWLGAALLFEEKGESIAERYYETATAIDRADAHPVRMLADYYARESRLAEAVEAYDAAIVLDPLYEEALYNSGLVLLDMDSVARAREQFRRAADVQPGYVQAHYYHGVASEMQGDREAARRSYQQAVNLSPNYEEAAAALARVESER